MGFLLNLLCVAVIAGTAIGYRHRPIPSAWRSFGTTALALLLAFGCTIPSADLVSHKWVAPAVEQQAANRLADMFSAAHYPDAGDTVRDLPFRKLIAEGPVALEEWLTEYGVSMDTLRQAAASPERDNLALLRTVTQGKSLALSRTICFAAEAVLLLILTKLIQRRLELNAMPRPATKGWRQMGPMLIGALTGVTLVFGGGILFRWQFPFLTGNAVFLSQEVADQVWIYQILNEIRALIRL